MIIACPHLFSVIHELLCVSVITIAIVTFSLDIMHNLYMVHQIVYYYIIFFV